MNLCPNLSNKKIKAEFDELVSIFGENMAYYLWDKSNGNGLELAPNGASSKLFQDLLKLNNGDRRKALIEKAKVYSDEFINWFGDWLSEDKTNVSKVVDENGEPLMVYHGTKHDFDTFDYKFFGERDGGNSGRGFYFTPNQISVQPYSRNGKILSVFLNVRNLYHDKSWGQNPISDAAIFNRGIE